MKKRGTFDEAINLLNGAALNLINMMDFLPQERRELRAAIRVLRACEKAPAEVLCGAGSISGPYGENEAEDRIARAILSARKIAEKVEKK